MGRLLAEAIGGIFLEGDDFHSETNKEKMRNGIPLTDADRLPWLLSLSHLLARHLSKGDRVVLSCSALTPLYRQVLRSGRESTKETKHLPVKGKDSLNFVKKGYESKIAFGSMMYRGRCKEDEGEEEVFFVHLAGSYKLFADRILARQKEGSHFMPPSLLQSQMDTLRVGEGEGEGEETIFSVDASKAPEMIVSDVVKMLGL